MSVVDASGRRVARVRMAGAGVPARRSSCRAATWPPILYEAARDDAEFLFDDTIVDAATRTSDGVDVTFERAAPRRFDLVVGADGLHSTVRRLAFGPEPDFVRHIGLYVATLPLGGPADQPREVLLYNTPGRLVSIHPSRGRALAAFIFRSPAVAGFDHRDTAAAQADRHAGLRRQRGWRVPELLEQATRPPTDLYFDSVSQVQPAPLVARPGRAARRRGLLRVAVRRRLQSGHGRRAHLGRGTRRTSGRPRRRLSPRTRTEHRPLVEPRQRRMGLAAAILVH